MERYKSYNVCQGCNCAILRGGLAIQFKQGFGYSHDKKHYHKSCFRKALKGHKTNAIINFFRMVSKYPDIEVDLKNNFFGIKV